MQSENDYAPMRARRGARAKAGLAALLALFVVALMAGSAQAGTPAYSLSINYAEGGTTPLYNPYGVATDTAGNVYATTFGGGKPATVQKFSASGKYLAKFGSSSGSGFLSEPVAVDVDSSGNVWVASRGNSKVVEFSPTGTVVKEVSSPGKLDGVAVDGAGNIWMATGEYGSASTIWKMDAKGTWITGTSYGLKSVHSIDVDSAGNVWVTQDSEQKVSEFSSSGTFIRSWIAYSRGISADASGNLWIGANTEVYKYSPLGATLDKFGSYGSTPGKFLGMSIYDPVAVGPAGAIWVADEPRGELQKWVVTP